jgi:methyltransferase, FkbM family
MITRSLSFIRRLGEFSDYTGGAAPAARMLIAMKQDPMGVQQIHYKGHPIAFRKYDESAIREVIFREEYGFLRQRLRRIASPKVLDVGANIGTFSAWVARENHGCRVVAIEPSKDAADLAERNLRSSALEHWTVIRRAASRNDSDILNLVEGEQSASHRIGGGQGIPVPCICLRSAIDVLAGPDESIDIMKVDIEGSEFEFLDGKTEELMRVNALVVELHPKFCDTDAVQRVVREAYQSVETVNDRRSSKPLLYCYRD